MGECSKANPLARSIRYLESQRTLYQKQTAQLEHFDAAVKEIQMNIKRSATLAYLDNLKEQLDEGFIKISGVILDNAVEKGGHRRLILHPPSFGRVIVEPGGRIYLSVHPTIGERVSGYMLEPQPFLEFFKAVKQRVSTKPVELDLKTEEIVNKYFVDECERNHVFLNRP